MILLDNITLSIGEVSATMTICFEQELSVQQSDKANSVFKNWTAMNWLVNAGFTVIRTPPAG